MLLEQEEEPDDPEPSALSSIIDDVARLLPAQGPIGIFIHHNTLHAFEDRPFEQAVVEAGRQLGCQPFLTEEAYRREIAAGRFTARDVEAAVTAELGDRAGEVVAGSVTRRELRCALAIHGVPEAQGPVLAWIISETPVLARYRSDLPADIRAALLAAGGETLTAAEEAAQVGELWTASHRAIARTPAPETPADRPLRLRDLVQAAAGVDPDERVHPVLIRFTSAYLDQGLASWTMPAAELGFHACFVALYANGWTRLLGPWARDLRTLLAEEAESGRDALDSLRHSLEDFGVPPREWRAFLLDAALALRGWAGMVRQLEKRPDRVPNRPVRVKLVEFLAVRLLLERAAIGWAVRERAGFRGPLGEAREFLSRRPAPTAAASGLERTWTLFHVAQICGIDPLLVERFSAAQVQEIEAELAAFSATDRRRVLHLAYERSLVERLYDALVQHAPPPDPAAPSFQAVFCLDEREESFRRHLEEIEPRAETFGAAGFFGVPMYYQGATDARPRPLCPVAIQPDHYVSERRTGSGRLGRLAKGLKDDRSAALPERNIYLGSHASFQDAVFMPVAGALAIVPLVLRVLFPGLGQRLRRLPRAIQRGPRTRLGLNRRDVPPPVGRYWGFTVEEQADLVQGLLEDMGVADRLRPLFLVVGHGSRSLNNPHESAYNCGACGGGRGGPNARAFAQMANDPRVRARLAARGRAIPPTTWFVGAERNTCSNEFDYFDADRIPAALAPAFEAARRTIDAVRQREAHERCRRFDDVPAWYPPFAALMHAESRAANLAQPRPEYGHSTNAFCFVGRRGRTRGLFLDRRAFLVSYDPTRDADGRILARVLAAIVPVVAGINLEYYFGTVDPEGYGCGTKLPHNVAALLGVMNGVEGDLRTGLTLQMVEIHEPVRLTLVVECAPDRLARVLGENPSLERLVRHRWIFVAALAPEAPELFELGAAGFSRYERKQPLPTVQGFSSKWYRGKRHHLRIAHIEGEPGGGSTR